MKTTSHSDLEPFGTDHVFDIEVYRNYFLVAFKSLRTELYTTFELSPDSILDIDALSNFMARYCLIGFNSIGYDMPILQLALQGLSNAQLKDASDKIIIEKENIRFTMKIPYYKGNHIDIFRVCPVNQGNSDRPSSLKLYAGRLHTQKMQDLPLDPSKDLTREEAMVLKRYCLNDLDNTQLLYQKLRPEIELRRAMSTFYNTDLRSKSDAQIAESVIGNELQKITGFYPKASGTIPESVAYNVPDWIYFQTPKLQALLEMIRGLTFEIGSNGSPIMPKTLSEHLIKVGYSTYRVGMGGLHSTESKTHHVASDDIIIADNDVESFYPRTILNQRLYPPNLGEAFLTVYQSIVDRRLTAKRQYAETGESEYRTISESLKITINGSFGKLGNKYSFLYAPQLMLQVTLTGQLVLLMLIEALEGAGIQVISGNTDGVVSKYPVGMHETVRGIIAAWERHTGYKTEETRYKALYSRDVNSYIALKYKGNPQSEYLDEKLGVKVKGTFSERGSTLNSTLSKNPETLVCIDAVLLHIVAGYDIGQTIRACKDIRRFVTVANVHGGAMRDGIYIGKTVRWYYARGDCGYLMRADSGNKVPNTIGARPLMVLPTGVPGDIDYAYYIRRAMDLLYDCGFKTYDLPFAEVTS